MADTAVAAPPAAAAPAAASTPASSSATSAAASSSSSAAASATTPAAAPATPEPGSPEFFTEALKNVAEEGTADVDQPGATNADEETPEQKAAKEAAAANQTPEEKRAAEAKAAEDARIAAEPPANQAEIDLGESIAPAALLESFDKAPDAVKEWWNDPTNPLKDTLTAMARRAAIADPILREIPDVETAQQVIKTSAAYEQFDNGFNEISTPQSAQGFWEKLWTDFAVKDDKGNITGAHPAFNNLERAIFDANAGALTKHAKESGTWSKPLANLLHDGLDAAYEAAKKDPNNADNSDMIAAIEAIREIRPRPSNKPVELTQEQKEAQTRIDRDRAALDSTKATERAATVDKAFATITSEVDDAMVDQFLPVLDKAGLSDFEHENAVIAIDKALKAELGKNDLYTTRKTQLTAAIKKDPSAKNVEALKKHELKYSNMKIGRITKEVLAKATAGTMKRQGDKETKRNEQIDRSKTEPRGTSSATTAAASGSNVGSLEASQAEWEKIPGNAGSQMDMQFHFNRIMGKKK